MRSLNEIAPVVADEHLPLMHVSQGLAGSKDGKGIGELVDDETRDGWVREYLAVQPEDADGSLLESGFRFGVLAEGRYAGQTFVEAEPGVRSEWSSGRDRPPWETIRDAVWSGFDRARDRRV